MRKRSTTQYNNLSKFMTVLLSVVVDWGSRFSASMKGVKPLYSVLFFFKNRLLLDVAWNRVAKAILISFILLLGNIDFLSAQVVLENNSTGTTLSTPTIVSHTTGTGSNRLMLVSVSFEPNSGQTVTGITYGGTPLNLVNTRTNGSNASVCLYSLVNPTSGTANVSVTFSSNPTNGAIIGVTTFTGVDPISPLS